MVFDISLKIEISKDFIRTMNGLLLSYLYNSSLSNNRDIQITNCHKLQSNIIKVQKEENYKYSYLM